MAQIPHADEGMICPLHKEDMSKVCHRCPWWFMVRGKDPQSEKQIDQWGCAIGFLPILLIEGTQQTHQAGAAIESLRNVVDSTGNNLVSLAMNNAAKRLS
jgi:hypothetical protein